MPFFYTVSYLLGLHFKKRLSNLWCHTVFMLPVQKCAIRTDDTVLIVELDLVLYFHRGWITILTELSFVPFSVLFWYILQVKKILRHAQIHVTIPRG